MASPLKAVPRIVRQALKGVMLPLTYRSISTVTGKAGAAYAIGATSINVTAATGAVAPGDTFGSYPYVVTNTVSPVGGVLTGVTFTPALTLAISSGSALTFSHNTDFVVRGIDRQVDVSFILNATIQANDYLFTLLADGLPATPKVADKIQSRDGKWLAIVATAYDAARATWTIQAR